MSAFAGLLRTVARLLNGLGALIVLPVLVCLVTLDVVMRYVFNAPLNGGLEASSYLLLAFFVCGLLESLRVGAHIKAEILWPRLPRRVRQGISLFVCAALVLVFGLLARKAAGEVPFLYSLQQMTPELHLPLWTFHVLIAVVAGLVVVYAVLAAVAILRGRRATVEEEIEAGWGE